ncbi:MAG: helix-turn-helix domain-containing protein [Rhodospirillaceae bacterium]|nr:helix-turn-helix domain-containing protein [Rhodospirillaceae bacterium]
MTIRTALGERMHREFERAGAPRAPRWRGLPRPRGSPASHRIPASVATPCDPAGARAANRRVRRQSSCRTGRKTVDALTFEPDRSPGTGRNRSSQEFLQFCADNPPDRDFPMTTPPEQESELLNIKEAAAMLKVSEASLRRWTNSGQLPCMRLGAKRQRRFRRDDLISFLENRESPSVSSQAVSRPAELLLEGIAIEYGRHICTLYESDLGRLKWSVPFLSDGLRDGDACFLIAADAVRDEILGHIEEAWEGVAQAIDNGQLILSAGIPDGEAMCRFVERSIFLMSRAGWRKFRLLGDMTWCLRLGMTNDKLFAYERRFNHEIGHRFPLVSVCQYDVREFSGPAVLNALKCHEDTFNYPLSRFLSS